MDHHFVPQFYLRGFCDSNTPEGQDPWIWLADFEKQQIERRAPKNIAKAANYYEFPGVEEAGSEPPESIFSKIESASAPAVKRLLSSETSKLDGQDRADLLFFMAAFVIRAFLSSDTSLRTSQRIS